MGIERQLSESATDVVYDLSENCFSGKDGAKVTIKPLEDQLEVDGVVKAGVGRKLA